MVIKARHLLFGYDPTTPVIDIPEWDVSAGERVFIHGPSGSGKTTLLSLLTGIAKPTSGTLQILGQDMTTLSNKNRDHFRGDHLGYIFQVFNLIPYLSVEENIVLPLQFSKLRRSRVTNQSQTVTELAAHLGIHDLLKKNASQLSVGQQQRVAAARALIGSPKLIVADEPTSSLDHDHRQNFIKLLLNEARAEGSTVLFVSHDHTLAPYFDRTVALSDINRGATK